MKEGGGKERRTIINCQQLLHLLFQPTFVCQRPAFPNMQIVANSINITVIVFWLYSIEKTELTFYQNVQSLTSKLLS